MNIPAADGTMSAKAAPGPRRASASPAAPLGDPVIVFDRVSKWYGPVIGLNEVSLELGPGITGLVGPNGAGKSTLMKLAAGQLRPDLGEVRVLGRDAWSATAKRHVGYCPEADTFYEEMSGREFVNGMALLCGYPKKESWERTHRTLELVGMADRAERRLRGYSKGMRQRIKLAQALLHDPELLILDEPLNGVDPVGRAELSRLFHELAAAGRCILVSSHQLEELERITDQIAVIARGRLIAQGTLAEIRDLLGNFPLSVRIETRQPRELAAVLLGLPEVIGVELAGPDCIVVRARQPRRFFAAIGRLAAEETFDVAGMRVLDSSAQAILEYLTNDK